MAFTPFVDSDLPSMANFNAKFLEAISDAVGQSAKIQTGSYTGTGTYGSANQCILTFEFVPDIFFICGTVKRSSFTNYVMGFVVRNNDKMPLSGTHTCDINTSSVDFQGYCFVNWGLNSIAYYGSGADYQMNSNGYKYYWGVLGHEQT